MSRFASFGFIILLFLLLSGVVFFGFFIFTPKIKEYRALHTELQQNGAELRTLRQTFDKQYVALKNLQEREKHINIALNRHFDEEQFKAYLQHYFSSLTLQNISREQNDHLQIDRIDVRAMIASPVEYYRFVDALNGFIWVVKLEGGLQFKGEEEGIETHFALKVYTQAP